MARSIASIVLMLLVIIWINAYRQGGMDAVYSWFAAKFLNRPRELAPAQQKVNLRSRGRHRARGKLIRGRQLWPVTEGAT